MQQVRWLSGAVAVVIAGAAVYFLRSGTRTGPPADAPARDIVTRRGQRGSFKLPDGTAVNLGADTRLTIPADYRSSGRRDVSLDGEAFFEVSPDAARPFSVSTRLGVAVALGTEFSVSTYPEARGMRVVVASGHVALRPRGSTSGPESPAPTTLDKGDMGRLDSSGRTSVRRVDPAAWLAWTRGAIRFDDVPLADAIPVLERWYDADIRLADPALAARRLTGQFKDQSLAQVVDLIARALGLKVVTEQGKVTLYPG